MKDGLSSRWLLATLREIGSDGSDWAGAHSRGISGKGETNTKKTLRLPVECFANQDVAGTVVRIYSLGRRGDRGQTGRFLKLIWQNWFGSCLFKVLRKENFRSVPRLPTLFC